MSKKKQKKQTVPRNLNFSGPPLTPEVFARFVESAMESSIKDREGGSLQRVFDSAHNHAWKAEHVSQASLCPPECKLRAGVIVQVPVLDSPSYEGMGPKERGQVANSVILTIHNEHDGETGCLFLDTETAKKVVNSLAHAISMVETRKVTT